MKYEINKGTLALVPNDLESSLVYEDNYRIHLFILWKKVVSILEVTKKKKKMVLKIF